MSAAYSALPEPPDDFAVAAKVSTTTPGTDLLETLGVLTLVAVVPALFVSAWLAPLPVAAGAGLLGWARKRRERRALWNEEELRGQQYSFTAQQLANIGAGVSKEAANALSAIPPGLPVSRWQLLRLLCAEMGEARANETLPAVLRFATQSPF